MTRSPRIGLLTAQDARDPRPVSGTPFHMARSLERHAGNVVHLGPVWSALQFMGRVRGRISRTVFGRQHDFVHGRLLAREYAWRFGRRLSGIDIIVAPFASTQIARLETSVPIIYASDTTFALMRDNYPTFTGLSAENARQAEEIEQGALSRAAVFTTPSQWAARSAEAHYHVAMNRVRVIPYGANLDAPTTAELAAAKQVVSSGDRCRLLFIGVNWEWKGGRIAYDALHALRDAGVDAGLTIVGCEPPATLDRTHVRVFPRLDKRVAADRDQLRELLLHADFHLFPTRSDCFGIAICEASAHGTPSLATDVGGVSAALSHGVNGELLPFHAGGTEFAARMLALRADRKRYDALMRSSRALYERRLNWDHWGQRMTEVIAELV